MQCPLFGTLPPNHGTLVRLGAELLHPSVWVLIRLARRVPAATAAAALPQHMLPPIVPSLDPERELQLKITHTHTLTLHDLGLLSNPMTPTTPEGPPSRVCAGFHPPGPLPIWWPPYSQVVYTPTPKRSTPHTHTHTLLLPVLPLLQQPMLLPSGDRCACTLDASPQNSNVASPWGGTDCPWPCPWCCAECPWPCPWC